MRKIVVLLFCLSFAPALFGQCAAPIGDGTVAGLDAAADCTNRITVIANGATPEDCTVGGGSLIVACFSNGTVWASLVAAARIGDGTVSAAEYNYINGVTSAIQTQLNAKEGTLTNVAGLAAALDDEDFSPGVETSAEGVLDLEDLQGAVTDGQVPNTITIDLATVATTANNLAADGVDAITEIAAAIKSGSDGKVVTGTAGTDTHCAQWNADGDLVTTGAVCGSGAGGTTPTRNAQTGTTYTFLSTDDGKVVTFSNAAAIAVTLPQATGDFDDGWFVYTKNLGDGVVTITPTTSTINGDGTTYQLGRHQSMMILSDGTNYEVFSFPGIVGDSNSVVFGRQAGNDLGDGDLSNVAIGPGALDARGNADYNTAIGGEALGGSHGSNSVTYTTAVGYGALGSATGVVADTTAVGRQAGGGMTSPGDRSIFLGSHSGRDETGDDTLIIDNRDRGSESAGRTDSLIYGIMSATVADQRLTFNAAVEFNAYTFATLPTVGNGVQVYCSDCDPGAGSIIACASSAGQTGAMAMKIAGNWDCMSR